MRTESHDVERIVELVGALKLTPRQIQEVFRILGHVLETSEMNKGRLLWCIGCGSIAMAAFKVGNPRIFDLLGSKRFDPKEALEFLTELLEGRRVDWWLMLFLTGGGLKVGTNESVQEVMAKIGLIENGREPSQINYLGQWDQGWGHSSDRRFVQIHEKIQQISQWD